MHSSPAAGYPHQQVAPQIQVITTLSHVNQFIFQRPMHQPPPHMMAPHMSNQPGQIPPYVPSRFSLMLKPSQKEAVDKLVGIPSDTIPPYSIPQRREFFEQLILINDEQGEQLTAPPQVSKSTIDLHRLYIAVRKRGYLTYILISISNFQWIRTSNERKVMESFMHRGQLKNDGILCSRLSTSTALSKASFSARMSRNGSKRGRVETICGKIEKEKERERN